MRLDQQKIQWKMSSLIGVLYVVTSEKGLCGIFWDKQEASLAKDLKAKDPAAKHLKKIVSELDLYFSGKLKKFTVPLDLQGTVFQKKVWHQLMLIPYGKTVSYRDIAIRLKSKAYRAVGSANGRNPCSIVVPCHRVISADGSLGGYGGGLNRKKTLLQLEQSIN